MRILTSNEVRQAEREAIARAGMSTLVLMQRAGTAVAQFCLAQFNFNSVCVICGKGNNGGDGLVAAEALRPVAGKVSVIILAQDVNGLSPDAAAMCSGLNLQPIWIADPADFDSDAVREALAADLIIDAVVGTGFKPPLRGLPKRAVDAMNDAFAAVVSVDLPSGDDSRGRPRPPARKHCFGDRCHPAVVSRIPRLRTRGRSGAVLFAEVRRHSVSSNADLNRGSRLERYNSWRA